MPYFCRTPCAHPPRISHHDMEVPMHSNRSHRSTLWGEFALRVTGWFAAILGPPITRVIGWVVIVCVPGLIRLPLFLVRTVRTHPWASGAASVSLLILALALRGQGDPEAEEFEFGRIDKLHQHQRSEDSADAGLRSISGSKPVRTAEINRAAISNPLAANPVDALGQTASPGNTTEPASSGQRRVVWLTGEIEEFPHAATIRQATMPDRYPFNK